MQCDICKSCSNKTLLCLEGLFSAKVSFCTFHYHSNDIKTLTYGELNRSFVDSMVTFSLQCFSGC